MSAVETGDQLRERAAGTAMVEIAPADRREFARALVLQGYDIARAHRMVYGDCGAVQDDDGALQMLARHRLAYSSGDDATWKAELERDFTALRRDYGRAAVLIERMGLALRPFAKIANLYDDYQESDEFSLLEDLGALHVLDATKLGLFRAARAALFELKGQSRAIADIASERQRQMESEGWTREHDDEHAEGELANAAAAYAHVASLSDGERRRVTGIYSIDNIGMLRDLWPWAKSWWKPKDRRADLVRAGALIAAEIERLDRAAAAAGADPQ